MTKLADLTPKNLLAEKAKFFASSSYEPQFEYSLPIDQDTLTFYGQPQKSYFDHASSIVKNFIKPSGTLATEDQVRTAVKAACLAAELPIIKIDFSPDHLSQARLEKQTLFIRTPIQFTVSQLKGKVHHEVETHYLRVLNNTTLGLPVATESFDFRSTEEGLANLHSYLDEPTIPMRKTCLSYIGCYLTQTHGFRAAYQELISLKVAPQLAWSIITRSKRGLTDTSQPGGFTKDRTYLEGAVRVWQWLLDQKNDVHDLYAGRISLNQVSSIKHQIAAMANPPKLHFPQFINDKAKYLSIIQQIGQTNQFDLLQS